MDLPQLSCGWCIKLDDCKAGGWWLWGRLWCAEPLQATRLLKSSRAGGSPRAPCAIGIFWEDIRSPQGEIMGKFIISAGASWSIQHALCRAGFQNAVSHGGIDRCFCFQQGLPWILLWVQCHLIP